MATSEAAMQDCTVPDDLTDGSMGSMLKAHVQDMQALAECASKHRILKKIVSQAQKGG